MLLSERCIMHDCTPSHGMKHGYLLHNHTSQPNAWFLNNLRGHFVI